MKIRLKALGELSELTGRKRVEQGFEIEVSKAKAEEAVKSGRWELVPDEAKASKDGGDKGE